jgi:hypothetical protein
MSTLIKKRPFLSPNVSAKIFLKIITSVPGNGLAQGDSTMKMSIRKPGDALRPIHFQTMETLLVRTMHEYPEHDFLRAKICRWEKITHFEPFLSLFLSLSHISLSFFLSLFA